MIFSFLYCFKYTSSETLHPITPHQAAQIVNDTEQSRLCSLSFIHNNGVGPVEVLAVIDP